MRFAESALLWTRSSRTSKPDSLQQSRDRSTHVHSGSQRLQTLCPSSSQRAPSRAFGKGIECGDDLWRAPDAAAWTRAALKDDPCLRQGFDVSARVLRVDVQLLG